MEAKSIAFFNFCYQTSRWYGRVSHISILLFSSRNKQVWFVFAILIKIPLAVPEDILTCKMDDGKDVFETETKGCEHVYKKPLQVQLKVFYFLIRVPEL